MSSATSHSSNSKSRSPFRAGSVFNRLRLPLRRPTKLAYETIQLRYPSRLNAMAIDPGRIMPREDFKYAPGEVLFSIALFKIVRVRRRRDSKIIIASTTKRPVLVRHATLLIRRALGFQEGFDISVKNDTEIKHCGLGSSNGTIAAVGVALNEAYGNPIPPNDLIRYLAQNHGEEIDGEENFLNPVQSIGGSAAAGLCQAGMIVLAGEAVPIATMQIPPEYRVVIGVPSDFVEQDSARLMSLERKAMRGFVKTGKRYGLANAYNVLHSMLPAMIRGDLSAIGDVIYKYRYIMGSIRNCSFTYQEVESIARALAPLKQKGIAPVLSLSSVGPCMFAITKKPNVCMRAFEKQGLVVREVAIHNSGYEVIRRMRI